MIIAAKKMRNFKLVAQDGEIGSAKDFLFDDQNWAVRYMIADTGSWLVSKKVLISPHALAEVSAEDKSVRVNLSKKQIENGPTPENDLPVSQQFEELYRSYYGFPKYLGGEYSWVAIPGIVDEPKKWAAANDFELSEDSHLRSTKELDGYQVMATDEEMGHIEDFLIDTESWMIRYLVIDTQNWWPGKRVLVSPQWLEQISWDDNQVKVQLSRKLIETAPAYDEDIEMTSAYEANLHAHYGKPVMQTRSPHRKNIRNEGAISMSAKN